MAAYHDVWVMTDEQSRRAIEDPVNGGCPPALTVEYVGVPSFIRAAGTYPAYIAWQVAAYRRAKKLHKDLGFHLVHHATFANSFLPSWLGRLGVPFIWYAGSFTTTKPSFLPGMGVRSGLTELLRNFALRGLGRVSRRLTLTTNSVAVTPDTSPRPLVHRPYKRLLVAALYPWERDLLPAPAAGAPATTQPFRVVSVGNLHGLKGFHLGLRAFARFKELVPDAEYLIVGDGEQRRRLEQLAKSLGIEQSVKLLGGLPRAETLSIIAACDVFLHPSLHEHFGFVILEAMAAARPVICLDLAGPSELVGHSGVVVPLRTPTTVIDGLTTALKCLHDDPVLRQRLGAAALQRVTEHWTWPRVARDIDAIYRETVAVTDVETR